MNSNTRTKLLIGILLFIAWFALVVFKVPDAGDIIGCIKIALAGLGVYHLGDRPGPPPAPAGRESGHASTGLLLALIVGAFLLTGCASIQQALTGYESAASISIDTANDNAVKVWKYQACQTPVSAALRSPDIIPAIKALCMPATGAPAASTLLDATAAAQPAAKL